MYPTPYLTLDQDVTKVSLSVITKKRGKYRHDDNNKSKQMKYVRLLILCIMLLPIVLLLIK